MEPIVISKLAKDAGLETSLFRRLFENDRVPKITLNVQYRMHPEISLIISTLFYNAALTDGVRDEERSLSLNLISNEKAVIFHSSNGQEEMVGTSFKNEIEATEVVEILARILKEVAPENIGVITPYDGQRREIYTLVFEHKYFDVLDCFYLF